MEAGRTSVEIDHAGRAARVQRHVAATPEDIFEVLADPSQHPAIDGSSTVMGEFGANPERLRPGARFGMWMRYGPLPYLIRNRVVEFEEGRLIAWRHFAGHRWRWELEPADGGTRVIHTFDWSTSRWPWALELLDYPESNADGMRGTVERLERLVASGAGGDRSR